MTVADPYPETLAEIDEAPIHVNADAQLARLVATLNRVAQALEQHTLALLDRPQNAPGAPLAALPPVRTAAPVQAAQHVPAGAPPKPAGVCPVHGLGWDKLVPAGNRKSDGKPYNAFWACPTSGCDQRPPR